MNLIGTRWAMLLLRTADRSLSLWPLFNDNLPHSQITELASIIFIDKQLPVIRRSRTDEYLNSISGKINSLINYSNYFFFFLNNLVACQECTWHPDV
jgi:hypothetical protein